MQFRLAAGTLLIILLVSMTAAAPAATVPKIVVINLAYDNGAVHEVSSDIEYGTAPNLNIQSGTTRGLLLDAGKNPLGEFSIRDPRVQMGDAISRGSDGGAQSLSGYTEYNPQAQFRIIVPFSPGLQYISFVDTVTGTTLVTVDISGPLAAFRQAYPDDPDIASTGGESPFGIPTVVWELLAVGSFVIVVLAGIGYLAVRRLPRPTRIMVVDDESTIVDLFMHLLTFKGYIPVPALNGKECLDLLKSEKTLPDLILLDIGMHGMDGWQTLEEIKKNPDWKKIPVLMLTGKQPTPAEAKRYGLCIDDYLLKPVDAKVLYSEIEYVLTRRKDIEKDIHVAIDAGFEKDMVCEYAKLKKRVEVEKKLKDIIRMPEEAEAPGGIRSLTRDEIATEMRTHEEKLHDLESRLSSVLAPHREKRKLFTG
ncbi:MAG: response regulator [Methanoregula sp.]|nr:response regulator [Methanoregula sp.]